MNLPFTKKQIYIGLITLAIVGVIGFYAYKKMKSMNYLALLKKHTLKWEGVHATDITDSAASNPSPWGGIHTSHGVTWTTFNSLSNTIGYAVTKDNFLNMPDKIWTDILMIGFAGQYPLSKISNIPLIQIPIITWTWGSGGSGSVTSFGSERRLAQFQRAYFGINDSNITKSEIVDNFKKKVNKFNEKKVFLALCDWRFQDFRRMNTWNSHGKGWTNRLNDLVFILFGVKDRYVVNKYSPFSIVKLPADFYKQPNGY